MALSLTIAPTSLLLTLESGIDIRIWDGVTDSGIPVKAMVHAVAAASLQDDPRLALELLPYMGRMPPMPDPQEAPGGPAAETLADAWRTLTGDLLHTHPPLISRAFRRVFYAGAAQVLANMMAAAARDGQAGLVAAVTAMMDEINRAQAALTPDGAT